MDWLTFKFCVLLLVCVSKLRSQELNSTSSLSRTDQSQAACDESQPIAPPDECNSCICFAGLVYCSNLTCEEQECVNDEEIPQPDPCNNCICRRGKVTCTNMICIPAPNCAEKHLYPSQNECNACMCLNGYITCTSNGCTEENLSNVTNTTTTTVKTPRKPKKCIEGSRLHGPNNCVECICVNGKKKCKNTCFQSLQLENRFAETSKNECVAGQSIPKPDDCNNCICFEGEIHCTHTPCHTDVRIGQECTDDQPVFRPDECNECYCFNGKLQCSNVVCIRGSKCVQDQEIPNPDSCNACRCIEGHILCTNYQCPELYTRNALTPGTSRTDVKSDECQDGDIIPPLPPPYECNTCFCIERKILCTMNSCVDSHPEIKGRLKEENEQNHLQMFDRQISVEPFIDILYKNNDKMPTKVIHTHAYNGFHQEIKVHANHLPKDATGLLKALATSLDNSALASISQKLLTSSDSLTNNHEVVQNNLLGEGNMFTTQSNKLIASGSQSNETILVIPDTEFFDSDNPPSVLPLANKHETIWKTVSVPASTLYPDNQLVQPRNSQEENLNIYNDDRPPIIASVQHNDVIRNPSKFTIPGLPRTFPTKPKPDTLELSNLNTHPNLILNPKPITINGGNMNYAPLYQDNSQFKPVSPSFATIPGHTPIFNYTLSSPGYGSGQLIATPNINAGKHKQSQIVPNSMTYYPNQVKPQEYQFKPNQNRPSHIIITNSNNKGVHYPPLFPNTPNRPIVSANQYKPPQFGLKPGQVNPLNNIGNQTDRNFKQFYPNFQIPPVTNLPGQNKRISGLEIQASKEKPNNSKSGPDAPQNGVNLEHTQHKPIHSQYIPNPSIYYKHEYEAPKINEINPDEEQLLQHSKLPFNYSEPDNEIIIPKVRNKTKKYNTTHSHYAKHTSVTYVSDYDLDDPAHPNIVNHEPNQDHNAPHTYEFDHYLTGQESQELDSTISKDLLDQKEYNPHSTDNRENTEQVKPNQNRTYIPVYPYISADYTTPSESQFMPPVDNPQKESLNDPNDPQSLNDVVEYPTHQKNNEYPRLPSQTGPIRNQQPRFQYAHNANQEPLQQKPVNNLLTSEFDSPQNNHLSGILDEREPASHSADPTYPNTKHNNSSNFDPDPSHYYATHPKDNLHINPQSQSVPTQNMPNLGAIDNNGIKDGYEYAHNANQNPVHLKPLYELPDFLSSPTLNEQKPETLGEKLLPNPIQSRGNLNNPEKPQLSPNQIQYPSKSAEHLSHPQAKSQMPLSSLFGPTQNQKLQEVIDDRGSAGGFRYPPKPAEKSTHPTDHLHNSLDPEENPHKLFDSTQNKQLLNFHYPTNSTKNIQQSNSPYGPTLNQLSPGIFDDRGTADGFQYPSHSAENPSQQKQLNSPYGLNQNQHTPGIIDDRGSTGGFQYPSYPAENPSHPTQPNSPYGPTKNLHSPGISDDRVSAGGFQYPSHSVKNPSHPTKPNSPYDLTKNLHSPGISAELGSAGGFQNPSHSVENPSHQKQPNSPYSPTKNLHSPGISADRGPAGGFQYPSHSAENPSHQKQPNSPYSPTKNLHSPGISANRGPAGGFQYPSHSVENHSHQKQPNSPYSPTKNLHSPGISADRGPAGGFQYPSHSAENPSHQKPPNSPYGPTQNQYTPGSFQYPSHSVKNPSHQKQPNSPYAPTKNLHSPGISNDRGSPGSFQYPSHSVENTSHQKPPNSPYGPTQNQHTPGIFHDRGSANGFQYPSHPAENPSHPKQPNSPYSPTKNLNSPGISDNRGSAGGFQYPSHSVGNPAHQKQPNSPYGTTQHQHRPGILDERGSIDGFQYPSHSAENTTDSEDKSTHSPFDYILSEHLIEIFGERGSTNGLQYPSHSTESSLQIKDNRHHPLQSQFLPSHNQYKDAIHKEPDSPFNPGQNKHLPGLVDERGSSDGVQSSHSTDIPLQTGNNLLDSAQSQFLPSHNQYKDNIHKKTNSPFDNTNKHPAENPFNSKGKLSHSPVTYTHNQHSPNFYYPSHSADNLSHPNQNQPNYNTQIQYSPVPFDKIHSSTAENPIHPNGNINTVPHPQLYPNQKPQNNSIHKQPKFPFSPTQIHDLPEVFEEVFQFTEDPTHSKNVPDKNFVSKLMPKIYNIKADQPDQIPDLHPILPTSNNYKNNNLLRPWVHLDHDQYKPSSYDNLLNGIHNIPWSIPDDHKESSTPQPDFESDRDQYKPSSLHNPPNGVHDISLPGHHGKVLNTITSAPKGRVKLEHDQYKPWSFDNSFNGIHEIPWSIPNQDSDVLVTDAKITTPRYTHSDNTQFNSYPETKPDSDPDKVLPIDDVEIPDYYNQLYPLLKVVKNLSELPFNESALTVDQLDLLSRLFSNITKSLNPENDHNNTYPIENNDIQRISPWSKIKSKFKQLPITGNGMLNWLKNKINKLAPIKNNITAITNDIDMTKIFNLLKKLTGPKINESALPQNMSFSSFDFQEDTLTTTSLPRTDATHSYDNRIKTALTELEENRTQAPQVKYPDVHIILHQPNDQDDLDLPPFIETEGLANLATDINSEDLGTLFSKTFNPRFRPKDRKEECGDGTYWISNCHGCSCYFGQAMCFKMADCKLRSFGEPMPCKPYSHFKMGCYTCECNGDGIAECEAKNCDPKLSGDGIVSETTAIQLPQFNEFFDSKKTNEILQYYNTYKKLPKYCTQAQHPTCEPFTSWISSCHKCECNESGKHECIKIDGCKLDLDSYGKPSRCKPNSKFYPKTNSLPCVECSCDDEGKSYCPAAE